MNEKIEAAGLLSENADERRMFDQFVSHLGHPLLVVANALTTMSRTAPQHGSYAMQLAIYANECVKAAALPPLRAREEMTVLDGPSRRCVFEVAREIIADGDARGIAAKHSTTILTRQVLEKLLALSSTAGQEWRDISGEMLGALHGMHAFIAVMFGRGPDATIPETINTPIGVPIKVGEIMREATAVIAKAEAAFPPVAEPLLAEKSQS